MPVISENTSRSSARPSLSSRVAVRSSTTSAPPIATSSSSTTSIAIGGISTVYATATVTVSTPYGTASVTQNLKESSTLPAGIVAGAVAGSVAVAVVLVLAWTYWAKKMKDRKRSQHFATLAAHDNPPWQKPHAYRRTTTGSSTDSERGINNTAEASEKVDTLGGPSSSAHHATTPCMTEHKPKKSSRRTLQKNRKAREHARQQSLLCPILDVDNESAEPASPTPTSFSEAPPRYSSPAIQYPSTVIRKASTVGSASIYSTQSGEERHMSTDADLLKAALGMPGLAESISRKPSNVSSAYSSQSGEDRQFSIMSHMLHPSQRRLTGWTPSLGSMYSAAEDQQQPSTSGGPRLGRKGAVGTPSRLSRFSFHDPDEVGVAHGGEAL